MRTKPLLKSLLFLGLATLFIMGEGETQGIAGIGKAAHVQLAIFHVYTGEKPATDITSSDEIGLLQALKGKAQMLAYAHTTGVKDGDVLMATTDILRGNETSAEDFGVDCQLFLHVKNDEDVSVGGLCTVEVYDISHAKQVSAKVIIKSMPVHSHWTLVGWDDQDHIAIYVNEEVGTE